MTDEGFLYFFLFSLFLSFFASFFLLLALPKKDADFLSGMRKFSRGC